MRNVMYLTTLSPLPHGFLGVIHFKAIRGHFVFVARIITHFQIDFVRKERASSWVRFHKILIVCETAKNDFVQLMKIKWQLLSNMFCIGKYHLQG